MDVAITEEAKRDLLERIRAALPKGWRAERLLVQEAEHPNELRLRLHIGKGRTRDWEWDVRRPLTDDILAGFKRAAEHDRDGAHR